MVTLTITEKGGKAASREFDKPEITIGRIQGNDIVLPKSNISKRHARIIQNGSSFVIIDSKSTNGTYINGKRIDAPYDLQAGDKIFVGDFTIEIDMDEDADEVSNGRGSGHDEPEDEEEDDAPPPPPKGREERAAKGARAESNGRAEKPTRDHGSRKPKKGDDVLADDEWDANENLDGDWADDWDASQSKQRPQPKKDDKKKRAADAEDDQDDRSMRSERKPREELEAKKPARRDEAKERAPEPPRRREREPSQAGEMSDEASRALRMVHERLIHSLDLRRLSVESMGDEELRTRTRTSVEEIVSSMQEAGEIPSTLETQALIDDVLDEAIGLGPLDDLMHDESVGEIMVNGARNIYVERGGTIVKVDRSFSSDQAVLGVIERVVAPLGRRVDVSSPMVDVRLKDGSRVNAIIPPLALDGPTITIRKFTRDPLLIDDLVAYGTLTAAMANFLETCVKARKNIVISGGTGSGKTTTLNVLSAFIPEGERIVTIEDGAELKLEGHVVRLESRPADIDGRGGVTVRDLLRNALRMFPQRIIVGDCRGAEALDMLQAMSAGHEGVLTTLHAGTPRDALSRLETMASLSGLELPARAVRQQIAGAVNVVVQQARLSDGSRRITHISEVTGIEGDVITTQDIFVFEQQGLGNDGRVMGALKPTGFVPHFYEDLSGRGIKADLEIFQT